jgi:hypothetical protein
VQIALAEDLSGVARVGGNVSPTLAAREAEVGVALQPLQFADRASITITAPEARTILAQMGVAVPGSIRSPESLAQWLQEVPTLSSAQVAEFLRRAAELRKGP